MEKMINKIETDHMTRKELRDFGLVTGLIVVLLFGLFLPYVWKHDIPDIPDFSAFPKWPWILAGILGTMGLLVPLALKPIYKGWMTFGGILGFINTRIILGILFFLVFLPFGVVMRLFGKDPMSRKLDADADTYRVISEKRDPSHLEKPY